MKLKQNLKHFFVSFIYNLKNFLVYFYHDNYSLIGNETKKKRGNISELVNNSNFLLINRKYASAYLLWPLKY